MKTKRLYTIILGPHTTEKRVRASDRNQQVVFKVAKDATKVELTQTVQTLFFGKSCFSANCECERKEEAI